MENVKLQFKIKSLSFLKELYFGFLQTFDELYIDQTPILET